MQSNESADLDREFECDDQIVLVLVGLVGSGKSIFATALQENHPKFRRCNQDELKSRKTVERFVRSYLTQGLSVCVDRTNIDTTQRSHWINIAREFKGSRVWCIVFDTPINVCADRLQTRRYHPTIKSPEQGVAILHRFASEFEPPNFEEGLDRIFYLSHTTHPSPRFTKGDLTSILERVRDSA